MSLASQIWRCVDLDILDGAEVLAEQLVVLEDSAGARFLLGYVQLRRGQLRSAQKTCEAHLGHVGALWVYANACLKLGQPHVGISAMDKHHELWDDASVDSVLHAQYTRELFTPSVLELLYAKLQREIDQDTAVDHFARSARLDPFLVENLAALATSTRVDLRPAQLFAPQDLQQDTSGHDSSVDIERPRVSSLKTTTSTPRRLVTPNRVLNTPLGPSPVVVGGTGGTGGAGSTGVGGGVPPLAVPSGIGSTGVDGGRLFQTPARLRERVHSLSIMASDQSSLSSLGKSVFAQIEQLGEQMPNMRASSGGFSSISGVLCTLLEALNLMSAGEFRKAASHLDSLPEQVEQAPFVQALRGRLLLECGEYEKAADQFLVLRKEQPDRWRDMEYMSTALWHAKRESELASLANELCALKSLSRRQWQSWCAMGNYFSLQNDSRNAIKCFERAVSIDGSNAYAYTLMGYEYCGAEELELANVCFRKALAKDANLYNAWYGLGTVCYGLGNLEEAKMMFLEALRLNPHNPVLLCYLGTVYEAQQNGDRAMSCFEQAAEENPDSPIPRFRKAEAFIAAGRFKDALNELCVLEPLAPEDSSVHVALARAYGGLGHSDLAVQHLTIAQNLAPKSAGSLRRIMESI